MNTKTNRLLNRRLSGLATVLLAGFAPVLTFTAARAASVTLTNSDGFGASSFNSAGYWNSGLAPSAGNSYFITNPFTMRTPATATAYTFAGDALYLFGTNTSTTVSLSLKGSNVITIPSLVLSNAIIQNSGTGYTPDTAIIAGNINVLTNSQINPSFSNRTLVVTAAISGSGGLTFKGSGTNQLSGSHSYNGPIIENGVQINMGSTFSMTPSSLTVGLDAFFYTPTNIFNTTNIVAAGGNLNVNGGLSGVLRVGIRTAGNTNNTVAALLDVSQQSQFTANVGNVIVGQNQDSSANGAGCTGVLLLATNNTITTTNFLIGDSLISGLGGTDTVTLGAGSNYIDTAILAVGQRKLPTLMTLPAGGTLVLTNSAGGGANVNVANNNVNTGGTSVSALDLSGGTVIATLNQLVVGQKSLGGAGGATGTLTMSTNAANRVTVTGITLGYMTNDTALAAGIATGTLTVGGGSVSVNNVTLAYLDVAGSGNSFGILNLNGGTFNVAGAITNGIGNGAINMTTATLVASNTVGTLAAPITKLAITNSILQFGASSVITNFAVSNLVVGGTANTIKIFSAPTNNNLATLPLVSYVNFSGTNNFKPDFTILSNTYPGLYFSGSITTNNNVLLLNLAISNITTTTLNALTGSTYGQSVIFTATVTPTPTGGSVQFYENAVAFGAPVLVSGGQAQLAINTLAAGNHPITATYSGTTGYNGSSIATSSTQTVRALPVVLSGTRTYDGTTTVTNTILSVANKIGSDTVNVASGSGTLASVTVGSQSITSFGTLALGNNTLGNYTLSGGSGSVTISKGSTFVGASSSENPSGYKDSVSFTTTLPADATGSVVFSSINGAFSTNSLSGGTTTSLSITNLVRGTNVITVTYGGDTNYLSSTTNLNQIVTNHPPSASVMTVTRTAGLALLITLSNLATNWSDMDGDTVKLTSVTMQSTNGINLVALNWNTNLDGSIVTTNTYAYIGYTNSPNVTDQISYGISDGQGGTNIGHVSIVIQSSVAGTNSITGHDFTSPNSNTVTAYGIPGYFYILERATNLISPVWVSVQTNQAATNGIINAADTFWDLGGVKPTPSAFYQLKWQP